MDVGLVLWETAKIGLIMADQHSKFLSQLQEAHCPKPFYRRGREKKEEKRDTFVGLAVV